MKTGDPIFRTHDDTSVHLGQNGIYVIGHQGTIICIVMFESLIARIIDQHSRPIRPYIQQSTGRLIQCIDIIRFHRQADILITPSIPIQQIKPCSSTNPHKITVFFRNGSYRVHPRIQTDTIVLGIKTFQVVKSSRPYISF